LKLIKRTEEENRVRVEQETKKAAEKAKKKGMGPVDKTYASLVNTNTTVAELGKSTGITEQNYEEIPSYLRPIAGTYPLGNVHMALRIGPLVIENGVSKYANQFPPFYYTNSAIVLMAAWSLQAEIHQSSRRCEIRPPTFMIASSSQELPRERSSRKFVLGNPNATRQS
jgi:hypothetical protein